MKIKILEFKVDRGNQVKIQSHKCNKGKWKVNPNFAFYKTMINRTPGRFRWHKEYVVEKQ